MNQRIASIDDPRVAPYRNLRERTLRGEDLFVAEGSLVVGRLLASRFPVESVLVSDALFQRIAPGVPDGVPVFHGPERLLHEVVGYDFHRGVLAAGRRPSPLSLDELMARVDRVDRLRLVVCPDTANSENLGIVYRSAAALGIDGVLLGPRCCDPLSRRCLRLSMGASLNLPTATSSDLQNDLDALKRRFGIQRVASVIGENAERLDKFRWPERAALLLGNEFDGLPASWLAECDHQVTVPMRPGTDSLNLGVAAGILLYEWTRVPR